LPIIVGSVAFPAVREVARIENRIRKTDTLEAA